MRIHYIIHAPFENLGAIETWANRAGHSLSSSHPYKGDKLPKTDQFDFLILMGGPQSPRDIDTYPYLSDEIALTQQAIDSNKIVLGFCLGAQIIAESLGAKTEQSPHKEVGLYPIELTTDGKSDPIFNHFSESLEVLHWHNDMPGVPKDAVILAKSVGCPRQAFRYGNRVYGLQFHPEMTKSSIQEMISNCPEDLQPDRYVQTKEELLAINPALMNEKLNLFLNSLVRVKTGAELNKSIGTSISPQKLSGHFVDLELLDETHREDLKILAKDESIWTYFPYDASEKHFDAWFDKALSNFSEKQQITFAVRSKQSNKLIGSTRYYDISLKHRRLAIGHTWYTKEVRGTFVNPETKFLMLTYAFETLTINRVEFFADARNLQSRAALKKLGACEEGILRQHLILEKNGYARDSSVFSILKSEWHEIKEKLLLRCHTSL